MILVFVLKRKDNPKTISSLSICKKKLYQLFWVDIALICILWAIANCLFLAALNQIIGITYVG